MLLYKKSRLLLAIVLVMSFAYTTFSHRVIAAPNYTSKAQEYCKGKYPSQNQINYYSVCYGSFMSYINNPTLNASTYCINTFTGSPLSRDQILSVCPPAIAEAAKNLAVNNQTIISQCNIVIKKDACIKAVEKCGTATRCANIPENKAITGGKVVVFCRTSSNPQACQTNYQEKCKNKTGDDLKACANEVANNAGVGDPYPGVRGSTPAGGSNPVGDATGSTASDLPGDQVDLNAKGAKAAKNTCGSGDSAVKTQIDLGCRGQGSAIEDLALALVRLLTYGVGIILVGSIIYAGIMYSASTGSPEATQKAKNRIRDAIIALIFYLLIGALIQFLVPGGLIVVK